MNKRMLNLNNSEIFQVEGAFTASILTDQGAPKHTKTVVKPHEAAVN